jgi:hypothetical protein
MVPTMYSIASIARVSASSSFGIKFACGFWRASHRAITGNSVRIEPSSRSRVGTFAFALTPVKGGLNWAPSRRLTGSV